MAFLPGRGSCPPVGEGNPERQRRAEADFGSNYQRDRLQAGIRATEVDGEAVAYAASAVIPDSVIPRQESVLMTCPFDVSETLGARVEVQVWPCWRAELRPFLACASHAARHV